VSMNETLENIVGTLQLLAKHQINRDLIRVNNELIQILVELLYNESEAVQRVAVATLSELANEKEGADKIEQEGAHVPLTSLLNSRNQAISSYSASILYQMSDSGGKSLDYKKQLTSELVSSLYTTRDELHNLNTNANNWQMTANDLDINNLLYAPQFATLNNSLTQSNLNPVNTTLYQDVYTSGVQATFGGAIPLDANDYGRIGQIGATTYGQITGTLQPTQAQWFRDHTSDL